MRQEPGIGPDDRWLAITTLSFDIALPELLLPLTVGAEVVIASREEVTDGRALQSLLRDSGATTLQATPSAWRLLLEAGWSGDRGLKALAGGEPLPPDLATALTARAGTVWNLYGPTETTVWSTIGRVVADEPITIGRPIAETTVRVLDPRGERAPIGVAGERGPVEFAVRQPRQTGQHDDPRRQHVARQPCRQVRAQRLQVRIDQGVHRRAGPGDDIGDQ